MNYRAWIDPRIAQLTVAQVRAYMLRHGWRVKPFPRPEMLVFERPGADNGQPITVAFVSSEHLADYRLRSEELLGTLGLIENRYAVEILDEMLHATDGNGTVAQPHADGVPAGK